MRAREIIDLIHSLVLELESYLEHFRALRAMGKSGDLRRLQRKLCKLCHPDHGGDTQLMGEVNDFFKMLQRGCDGIEVRNSPRDVCNRLRALRPLAMLGQ